MSDQQHLVADLVRKIEKLEEEKVGHTEQVMWLRDCINTLLKFVAVGVPNKVKTPEIYEIFADIYAYDLGGEPWSQ